MSSKKANGEEVEGDEEDEEYDEEIQLQALVFYNNQLEAQSKQDFTLEHLPSVMSSSEAMESSKVSKTVQV